MYRRLSLLPVRRRAPPVFVLNSIRNVISSSDGGGGGGCRAEVAMSHPWPEWEELMERLLQKGYLVPDGFQKAPKASNHIRTACLNFARDRFGLIRFLSRRDIQVIVGFGCPSVDRKVVNSGKRLRAHVGIEEGNICGSCNLRGSCERAYAMASEDGGGRTVDVMRILLTYGFDVMTESQLCLKKNVEESSRKLLCEILRFSCKELDSNRQEVTSGSLSPGSQQESEKQMPKGLSNTSTRKGDWICSKCNFLNFSKNIRCLRCNEMSQEKLKKLREDREHLPLKRGDWICNTCNFLNFAKNTRCLQCNEKPVQRQLGPGEWECVSCNYINFRKNALCLRCGWKRPKASITGTSFADFHQDEQRNKEHSETSFLRKRNGLDHLHFLRQENTLQDEDTDFWSSGEERTNMNESDSFSDFEDFPIVGGKSAISRDPLEKQRWKEGRKNKERWKEEMAKDSRSFGAKKCPESDGGICSADFRHLGLDDVSDDDEMNDWFGEVNEKNGS